MKIFLKSNNPKLKDAELEQLALNWDDDYLEVIDQFGRKWKLTPVKNENIKQPFIIIPL